MTYLTGEARRKPSTSIRIHHHSLNTSSTINLSQPSESRSIIHRPQQKRPKVRHGLKILEAVSTHVRLNRGDAVPNFINLNATFIICDKMFIKPVPPASR